MDVSALCSSFSSGSVRVPKFALGRSPSIVGRVIFAPLAVDVFYARHAVKFPQFAVAAWAGSGEQYDHEVCNGVSSSRFAHKETSARLAILRFALGEE